MITKCGMNFVLTLYSSDFTTDPTWTGDRPSASYRAGVS